MRVRRGEGEARKRSVPSKHEVFAQSFFALKDKKKARSAINFSVLKKRVLSIAKKFLLTQALSDVFFLENLPS